MGNPPSDRIFQIEHFLDEMTTNRRAPCCLTGKRTLRMPGKKRPINDRSYQVMGSSIYRESFTIFVQNRLADAFDFDQFVDRGKVTIFLAIGNDCLRLGCTYA